MLGIVYSPEHMRVYACLASGALVAFVVASPERESRTLASLKTTGTLDEALQLETLGDTELGGDESFHVVDVYARHSRQMLRHTPVQSDGALATICLVGAVLWCGGLGTITVLDANTFEKVPMRLWIFVCFVY